MEQGPKMRGAARISALALTLLIAAGAPPRLRSQAVSNRTVSSTQQLLEALEHAGQGEVIRLAPGLYSGVSIQGFSGSATIAGPAEGPAASIIDFVVSGSHGLTFSHVTFATQHGGVFEPGFSPFRVIASDAIVFDNDKFRQDFVGPTEDASAYGLSISRSKEIVVRRADFTRLRFGVLVASSEHVTIDHSTFHDLREHGVHATTTSFLTVDHNAFNGFHYPKGVHPDAVFVGSAAATPQAHDIAITNNSYERGSGLPVQGYFVKAIRGKQQPIHQRDSERQYLSRRGLRGDSPFGNRPPHGYREHGHSDVRRKVMDQGRWRERRQSRKQPSRQLHSQ